MSSPGPPVILSLPLPPCSREVIDVFWLIVSS
jgi:hypothetical protein